MYMGPNQVTNLHSPTIFSASLVPALLISLAAVLAPALAQSQLLESVKQNPARAKALCSQFQGFNAQGFSATSPTAVGQIASQQNLSPMDSEVLITYVIGLYCPDVR
jgi:7-keto-8-aminopelargonate synthetase-like enzyme